MHAVLDPALKLHAVPGLIIRQAQTGNWLLKRWTWNLAMHVCLAQTQLWMRAVIDTFKRAKVMNQRLWNYLLSLGASLDLLLLVFNEASTVDVPPCAPAPGVDAYVLSFVSTPAAPAPVAKPSDMLGINVSLPVAFAVVALPAISASCMMFWQPIRFCLIEWVSSSQYPVESDRRHWDKCILLGFQDLQFLRCRFRNANSDWGGRFAKELRLSAPCQHLLTFRNRLGICRASHADLQKVCICQQRLNRSSVTERVCRGLLLLYTETLLWHYILKCNW